MATTSVCKKARRFAVHGASILQTRQLPTLIIPQIDLPDNPGLSNRTEINFEQAPEGS